MNKQIGFIGLGKMGLPMATNLLNAGYSLRVYNRSPEKAKPLAERGVEVVQHPFQVVETGSIVVTMLTNDQALESIVLEEHGILNTLGSDGVHLSMSTVSPATAKQLAAFHEQQRSSYIAAPVFGRPDAAAAKKLWIALSGQAAAKDRIRPILDQLGQGVFDFGEAPEAAHAVKLSGNFLITAAIEAMAEAFTLAEKSGADRAQIAQMMSQTLFACPIYQNYGRMVVTDQQYEQPTGFDVSLGLKDLTLALQTAEASDIPMPIATLLHNRFQAAADHEKLFRNQ